MIGLFEASAYWTHWAWVRKASLLAPITSCSEWSDTVPVSEPSACSSTT